MIGSIDIVAKLKQHAGRQHGDDGALVGYLRPAAFRLLRRCGLGGSGARILLDQEGRRQECQENDAAGDQERGANSDQGRQRAAEQRTDQGAGRDAGRQHAERPAGTILRRLHGDQDGRARGIAAGEADQQSQQHQLPDGLAPCRSATCRRPCRNWRAPASACDRSGRPAVPRAARPSAAAKKVAP